MVPVFQAKLAWLRDCSKGPPTNRQSFMASGRTVDEASIRHHRCEVRTLWLYGKSMVPGF